MIVALIRRATVGFILSLPAFAAPVDFVREVRPIFEKHCTECHGEKKQKSGLQLDVKAAALKGGDGHGPAFVAGKPQESPVLTLVTSTDKDERMPPKGDGLSAAEVATLTRWIAEGAQWPDGVDRAKLEDRRDHWSFKPLAVPPGEHTIDRFIDEKLTAQGLQRSPPADPVSLLRRLTFNLTGLPPTPEEVAAFLADISPSLPPSVSPSATDREKERKREGAIRRTVDRLLASPRYGERWAQHWLDVVRFADTHGFEVNTERPNAWPYRDYVIRAFNDDTPYDRFIREQLVGDALGADAATGFLVTASVLLPGQIGKDAPSMRLARQDSLDEIVNNIGQTFLGLSVGCARCHDHKFDPISARDYYAMQAFVAGVEYREREFQTPEAVATRAKLQALKSQLKDVEKQLEQFAPLAKSGAVRPMVNARENRDRFRPVRTSKVRFSVRATNNLEPCLDELEVFNTAGENVALGANTTVSGENVTADRHEQRFVNDGKYGNSRSWMSNEVGRGWVVVEFDEPQEIDRVVWGRDREGKFKDRLATAYVIETANDAGEWQVVADSEDRQRFDPNAKAEPSFSTTGLPPAEAAEAKRLLEKKRTLEAENQKLSASLRVFAGSFRNPDEIRLLSRGDPEQPKDLVTPAVLSALGDLTLPQETPEQQRRRALADWIASPQNPLTARVMVNRIWQGHFGTGLVATPSDFGRMGLKPSHPELLDWLANEFIRSGWSVKHLHRLIVMSGTFRQSSRSRSEAAEKDADTRLLWRFPSRRLEAETLRDAMLAVSGSLNLTMYGRGFDLFDKRGGLSGFNPVETFTPQNQRRMIYAHKVRREPETVFGAFDCPDAGQSTALRRASTTPIQALNLFNSRFTLHHAEAFAARVVREAGADPIAQIRRAYRLALQREPTAAEIEDAKPLAQEHGAAVLCRALLNSNEFVFLP